MMEGSVDHLDVCFLHFDECIEWRHVHFAEIGGGGGDWICTASVIFGIGTTLPSNCAIT